MQGVPSCTQSFVPTATPCTCFNGRPCRIHRAGSILTAGCLAAIGAVMAVSMPTSPQPLGASRSSKQLPLLVALLSIYSVVAEASIGGLSITGKCCMHEHGSWPLHAPERCLAANRALKIPPNT